MVCGAVVPEKKQTTASGSGTSGSVVLFAARDSVVYNLESRSMELLGKATIDDQGTSIKAPRIVIDFDTSLLHAFGTPASSTIPAEKALFTDRQGSFNAEAMSYNFKTRSGETTTISSSYNGIYFTGEHVSKQENGEMIVREGTFTTCDDEHPHYWFSSPYMVINPESDVTAKPLVMYVRPELFAFRLPAIPILALPYMTFPLKENRASGFLMPHLSRYNNNTYLSSLGYFWAIDNYMDFRTEGDIALNGNWRLGERFRYSKRDKFNGEIRGEYKQYSSSSEWNAKIIHNQVFDPSSRLDVNLDYMGGSRAYELNTLDFKTIVSEQTNGYASLAKTFNNENSIAVVTYNSTKDLSNYNTTQSLASTWYENRQYPFRSGMVADKSERAADVSITTGAFFNGEKTTLLEHSFSGYMAGATVEAGYYREFADGYNVLFTQGLSIQAMKSASELYDNSRHEINIVLPLQLRSTMFSHFNINPSLTYIRALQTDGAGGGYATTIFGVDAATRLYGTLETGFFDTLFGLKALRHTFIPTISYTWNPEFSNPGYNNNDHYYYDWPNFMPFNWFDNSRNTGIPGGQSSVQITLKNLFQGKFRGVSSSREGEPGAESTVQLLSLSVSGACNFAADAFRLAPLTVMGTSNALAPIFLFSAGSMYDFYSYDPVTGERMDRLNSDDGKGRLRFVKGFASVSMGLQGKRATGAAASDVSVPVVSNTEQALFLDRFRMSGFTALDYTLPWQVAFSVYLQTDKTNPLKPSSTSLFNTSARAALSRTWQTGFSAGYDVQSKKVVFPVLQAYHDLHCWQMGFQWVPSGEFRGYSLHIGLKSPGA